MSDQVKSATGTDPVSARRIAQLESALCAQQKVIDELCAERARTAQPGVENASEHLLAAIIEAIDGPVCLLDSHGQVLSYNSRWLKHTASHLGGDLHPNLSYAQRLRNSICGPDAEISALLDAVEDVWCGRRADYSDRFQTQLANESKWYRLRVYHLKSPTAHAALVMHFDMTAHIEGTENLRKVTEEATMLSMVAKYTGNSVIITDHEGRIEWSNPAFTAITGYTLEEARGKTPGSLLQGEDSDPRVIKYMKEQLRHGRGFTAELINYRKSGKPFWVSMEVRSIIADGNQVIRYIGIQSDISSARKNRERIHQEKTRAESLARELSQEKAVLEGLLASVPVAVAWKDFDLSYRGCNQAFCELFGARSPQVVIGKPAGSLTHADPQSSVFVQIQQSVLDTGKAIVGREVSLRIEGRPDKTLLYSVVPLRTSDGTVEGVVATSTDITPLRELESELHQARRLKAIGQLAAGVAHEINTPSQYLSDNLSFVYESVNDLQPLLRQLTKLAQGGESEGAEHKVKQLAESAASADLAFLIDEIPEALRQSLDGIVQIKKIVLAMKEFSHPSGAEKDSFDLNSAINTIVAVSKNEWKFVADIELQLDESLPLIPAVASSINQVLLNLIVNAAHAMAGKFENGNKGTIVIRSRGGDESIGLIISDNGSGMSKDVEKRIFEPFFTTKEVGIGTGQGLPIVHRIVTEDHGGTIQVHSEQGQGTSFYIELPRGPDIFVSAEHAA